MTRGFVGAATWLAWTVVTVGAAEAPRCPPTAAGDARLRGPAGWTADAVASSHPFERIELFAGAMGEQTKEAPASLAPDDERRSRGRLTQVWRVGAETGGVVLVCRYRGTPAALAISLPAEVETCEQTLGWDAKRGSSTTRTCRRPCSVPRAGRTRRAARSLPVERYAASATKASSDWGTGS
jgi:hypothetical protein